MGGTRPLCAPNQPRALRQAVRAQMLRQEARGQTRSPWGCHFGTPVELRVPESGAALFGQNQLLVEAVGGVIRATSEAGGGKHGGEDGETARAPAAEAIFGDES